MMLNEQNYDSPDFFSETLKTEYGIFVTLHKNSELRGCIGYVEGIRPLQHAVEEMAISAAFKDPRFPPVTAEEFEILELEISVLSPLQEIQNIEEIEVGTHGLVIEKGYYRGLLLPQVAVEYKWDRETFLKHTCHKAGLAEDAWKDKSTKIKIFSAEIFSESEHDLADS
jgi:AmmeMemoRadiSam system protein A